MVAVKKMISEMMIRIVMTHPLDRNRTDVSVAESDFHKGWHQSLRYPIESSFVVDELRCLSHQ